MIKVIIREIRIQKRMTLRELSELTGLSKSALSRIEREEVPPNLYQLDVIAKALKMTPQDLYRFTKS